VKPRGHQQVAETAGLPLLEQAFSGGASKPRLGAFYLGNWITDLSQVVDPVAVAGFRDRVTDAVHDVFDTVLNGVYHLNDKLRPLSQTLDTESLGDLRQRLTDDIRAYFDALSAVGSHGHSRLYEAVQPGVLLAGYFKFVHPKLSGEPQRMDLATYVAVFDAMFTQYYPHEHLDRPTHRTPVSVTPPTNATQYDDLKANGPRNVHTGVSQSPDLYDYLRDDLEIIAGRLAELDLNWASRFLTQSPVPDDHPDWNLGLAKLGQALHGIEDFFAHSNYVELASTVLGTRYLPSVPSDIQFIKRTRYLKRLRRYDYWSQPADWTKNPEEDFVVTGYFDSVDTLISLAHLAESGLLGFLKLFGLEPVDLTDHLRVLWDFWFEPERTDEAIVRAADSVMHDLLEIADDPRKLSASNPENEVVQAIQKAVQESPLGRLDDFIQQLKNPSTTPADMAVLIANMPMFQDIDPPGGAASASELNARGRILSAFLNFVRAMLLPVSAARAGVSLYSATRTVVEFTSAPWLWLEKELGEAPRKYLQNAALHLGREALYYAFGLERIGCHSLISKDHGDEVLYMEARNCATAAHYYVVATLLRWQQPGYAARPAGSQWVDWLELLEHFSQHPKAGVVCAIPKEVPVEIPHVVTGGDRSLSLDEFLKRIATQYQPVILMPTGLPLGGRDILHVNCSTRIDRKNVVPVVESAVAALLPVYVGVPLLLRRVVIPFIRHTVMVCDPTAVAPRWYMPVMQGDWTVIKTQSLHTLRFHPNRDGAVQQAERGDNVRRQWETFYRPP
jgi:hypothetical protein